MKDDKMEKVQFVHVRQVDKDGNVQPKGGMTFCYVPTNFSNDHVVGHSFCSHSQLFNKAKGRDKALGRTHTAEGCSGLMTMAEVTTMALNTAITKDSVLAKRFDRPRMLLEVCPKYKGKKVHIFLPKVSPEFQK